MNNVSTINEVLCVLHEITISSFIKEDDEILFFTQNSKEVTNKSCFVCLIDKRDGHDFINDAVAKGANLIIGTKNIPNNNNFNYIQVTDCYKALSLIAVYKRQKSCARFIAITGSAGKTSLKEMLNHSLGRLTKTYVSPKSFNNELGVSLSLCNMDMGAEFVVLECGMSSKGEIEKLVDIIKPNISVITTVAVAHFENFKSVKDIAKAKAEIFHKQDGKEHNDDFQVILPWDNEFFDFLYEEAKKENIKNIKTFGSYISNQNKNKKLAKQPDIYVKKISYDKKMNVEYQYNDQDCSVGINLFGIHNAILFSIVVLILDQHKIFFQTKENEQYFLPNGQIDFDKIFTDFFSVVGRGQRHEISYNNMNVTIIDETYNANPASIKAALTYVSEYKKSLSKKIAIIGDMLELGNKSYDFHHEIVNFALAQGFDLVIIIGEMMEKVAKANKSDNLHYFSSQDKIFDFVKNEICDNTTIIAKASRGMNLDKLVTILRNIDN